MNWIEPKLDWVIGNKVTFDDFNRIENNIGYLSELTGAALLHPIKTDWTKNKAPFSDELNRIENTVDDIRVKNSLPKSFGWEAIKTWNACLPINYIDLNRIENNLLAIKNMYSLIPLNYKYCGSFTCGGVDVI